MIEILKDVLAPMGDAANIGALAILLRLVWRLERRVLRLEILQGVKQNADGI